MSSNKRKRVVVSIETKLEAIQRIHNGESIKKVAEDLGVGAVTVGDWNRKRNELEKWCAEKANCSLRKTMKKCAFEKTSESLFLWFTQLREKGSPISGPMLQAKALDFHKMFDDGEDFTASSGWLDRWKKRYGIRQLNISGEKLSADCDEVVKFKESFKNLIAKENLKMEQLFNCDETGLNFRMLPSKTLAAKDERSAPGYKKSKERVTLLACSNASGNLKLKTMLIGKSKKPRAFKNVHIQSLPVYYKNQKSAWMDADLFKKWFFDEFVPNVETFLRNQNLPRKAVLLLDNAPCHPNDDELVSGNIKALFLPPNVTSLIQPLDQGVLENMKRNYRKKLLKALIEGIEENKSVPETLKSFNLKDAVYWIAEAWDEVKSDTIIKSWRKIIDTQNIEYHGKSNEDSDELLDLVMKLPVSEPINEEDICDWINADEQQEITDEMIVNIVNKKNESSDDEDSDDENRNMKISHTDGLKAIENAIEYIEQQEEATPAFLLSLKKWRNIAAEKRKGSVKQKTINDFFK